LNVRVDPTVILAEETGVAAIEDNTATGNIIAGLVTPDKDAVMFELPVAIALAKPVVDIATILELELAQVTVEVISAVELSEYVPVALNCKVKPTDKVSGESGVIAIDDNTGATTIKLTAGLVTPVPDTATVMLVVPRDSPVAIPFSDIVAMSVAELAQVKFEVR